MISWVAAGAFVVRVAGQTGEGTDCLAVGSIQDVSLETGLAGGGIRAGSTPCWTNSA